MTTTQKAWWKLWHERCRIMRRIAANSRRVEKLDAKLDTLKQMMTQEEKAQL